MEIIKGDIYKRIALARREWKRIISFPNRRLSKKTQIDNFVEVYAIPKSQIQEMIQDSIDEGLITQDDQNLYTKELPNTRGRTPSPQDLQDDHEVLKGVRDSSPL